MDGEPTAVSDMTEDQFTDFTEQMRLLVAEESFLLGVPGRQPRPRRRRQVATTRSVAAGRLLGCGAPVFRRRLGVPPATVARRAAARNYRGPSGARRSGVLGHERRRLHECPCRPPRNGRWGGTGL